MTHWTVRATIDIDIVVEADGESEAERIAYNELPRYCTVIAMAVERQPEPDTLQADPTFRFKSAEVIPFPKR